jgi:hypothetical protein
VKELTTLARVEAFDMLGEGERAVATMERYMRPATTESLGVPKRRHDASGAPTP